MIHGNHGCPFFIALIGDVHLKGANVTNINPPVNKYKTAAAFKGLDVYMMFPKIPVANLWKGIVCFRQLFLVQGKGCRGSASGRDNGKHLDEIDMAEL